VETKESRNKRKLNEIGCEIKEKDRERRERQTERVYYNKRREEVF